MKQSIAHHTCRSCRYYRAEACLLAAIQASPTDDACGKWEGAEP